MNANWILQCLSDRGRPLCSGAELHQALAELPEPLAQELRAAATAMANGRERAEQFEFAFAVAHLASGETRARLAGAGLSSSCAHTVAAMRVLGVGRMAQHVQALPDPAAIQALAPLLPRQPPEAPARPPTAPQAPRAVVARHSSAGPAGSPARARERAPGSSAQPTSSPTPAPGPRARATRSGRPVVGADVDDAPTSPSPAPEPSAPSAATRTSHHVWANQAAACIEPDQLRTAHARRRHSLRVELAARVTTGASAQGAAASPDNAARAYDWPARISVQLTLAELPLFAAVLLGFASHFQARFHGPAHDKGLELRAQATSHAQLGDLVLSATHADRRITVPVGASDRYELCVLALQALRANAGAEAPPEFIVASLRAAFAPPDRNER